MIDGLMEWSRNIVCFSIFSVLIRNLLPGEKYTPYVQLYIGFMTLLVFLTPVLKVLNADRTLHYLTEILSGTLEIKEDAFLESINENSNYEKQKEAYTKVLEESVLTCLSDYLEKEKQQDYIVERAEVKWEEDEKSDQFGAIVGVAVYLKKREDITAEKDVVFIDPITVEVFSGAEEATEETIPIKEMISEFYHLSMEEILIKIIE